MASKRPRVSLPSVGPPCGKLELYDPSGNLLQRRWFAADGRAVKNIDFGHDHTGVGDPHVHDWDWTLPTPRQAPRPIQQDENP